MNTEAHPQIDRPANSGPERSTNSGPERSTSRTWLARMSVASVAVGFGVFAHLAGTTDSGAREAPKRRIRIVEVAPVQIAPAHRIAQFTGVVRARQRARLGFTLGGRIVSRPAQVGDRVKAGQVLAKLDTAPLIHAQRAARAQLADADAGHAQLRRDLARTERLVAQKAAVAESLEKLRSGFEAATASKAALAARLAEADRQLAEARLVAPFSGTVLSVFAQPGETARPGQPILVLSAEDQLEVEVRVPERVHAGLQADAEAQIKWPLAGLAPITGRIRQLGRAAAGPGELFSVIVALPEDVEKVVPGFTAEVSLPVRQSRRLLVPVPAVSDPGGHAPFVYRVKDGVAERVSVQVQSLFEAGVTVQGDLHIGDQLIIRGHASLLPGEAVQVRQ